MYKSLPKSLEGISAQEDEKDSIISICVELKNYTRHITRLHTFCTDIVMQISALDLKCIRLQSHVHSVHPCIMLVNIVFANKDDKFPFKLCPCGLNWNILWLQFTNKRVKNALWHQWHRCTVTIQCILIKTWEFYLLGARCLWLVSYEARPNWNWRLLFQAPSSVIFNNLLFI